jgi:hypothetical protein
VRAERNNSFNDPPPLAFENDLGRFELVSNRLRIAPAEHFATPEEARSVFDQFLRAWEIEADLRPTGNIGMIRFNFDRAERIDRDPPKPGASVVLDVHSVDVGVMADSVELQVGWPRYPAPPEHFRATVDVEILWSRYLQCQDGKEPLPAMSYFVLSYAETTAGSRGMATTAYGVERAVLDTIGRLTSLHGNPASARKFPSGGLTPLTPKEEEWLRRAVKRLIIRVGEASVGVAQPTIAMSDFPTLGIPAPASEPSDPLDRAAL